MVGSATGLTGRVTEANAKWYTLVVACLALFMAMLDNLVVNVAMPTMARDFGADASALQWIISAYTLVFASLQITAGGLGDRFGRRRWFLVGLALFTATSALAAVSQDTAMLIVARAIQGIGAAFILPLFFSLISAAVTPAKDRVVAASPAIASPVSAPERGPVIETLEVDPAD